MNAIIEPIVEARLRKRISNLEAELERAQDRIQAMEDTFGLNDACHYAWLGLTAFESRILAILVRNTMATRDQIMFALYEGRPEAYDRDPKILDVYCCHLRKKLAPIGVTIENVWGRGKRIPPADKDKLMHAKLNLEARQ
jgi:two-component system cell cycle response regulator CtrA